MTKEADIGGPSDLALELLLGLWLENEDISQLDIQIANNKKEIKIQTFTQNLSLSETSPSCSQNTCVAPGRGIARGEEAVVEGEAAEIRLTG